MRKLTGVSLIELVVFIVIISIVTVSLGASLIASMQNSVPVRKYTESTLIASSCMDWYVGQRDSLSFKQFNILHCANNLKIPDICKLNKEYKVSGSCKNLRLKNDPGYKQISINVKGPANASLTTIFGEY